MASRELSITYGALLIGGNSTRLLLDGRYRLEREPDEVALEFDFVAVGSTEASFAQAVRSVEEGFRKPFLSCTVSLGSQVLERFGHGESTGFDARPTLSKRGDDETDSGRSRKYTVRILFGIPADRYPRSGLRDSQVELRYGPNRRAEVTIRGLYTAVGTRSARGVYDAGVDAFAAAVLTALGITLYELVEEDAGPENTTSKTIDFERIYQEIIYGQGAATLTNDATLSKQELSISRRIATGEDAIGRLTGASGAGTRDNVHRLYEVDLSYKVAVNADQTTDLEQKYASLRPWLIQRIKQEFPGNGAVALISERPELERDENRISVTMTALAVAKGAQFFSRTITVEDRVQHGQVLVPVWDGNPISRYVYQGPTIARRSYTETYRAAGAVDTTLAEAEATEIATTGLQSPPAGLSVSGRWITINTTVSFTPVTLGIGENKIEATDVTTVIEREFYKEVQRAGGGGITKAGADRRALKSRAGLIRTQQGRF